MQNLAQAAVDSANAAYLNSGIAQRLRLVHRQQVAYTERTNCCGGGSAFDCALDDLTDNGDGYIDNVHALRNKHGADLVALLINDSAFCGLAWLPSTPSADLGFSVTAHNCAVGNKSFAHEVGHNMGAHHDPANASRRGPKPFNKGYVSPQSELAHGHGVSARRAAAARASTTSRIRSSRTTEPRWARRRFRTTRTC